MGGNRAWSWFTENTIFLLYIYRAGSAIYFGNFIAYTEAALSLKLLLLFFIAPALIVFAWLPLFALGIVIARLLTPLSWIVGRTQWALKEGNGHPIKAIGYVAAVVVLLGTVAVRAVFSVL